MAATAGAEASGSAAAGAAALVAAGWLEAGEASAFVASELCVVADVALAASAGCAEASALTAGVEAEFWSAGLFWAMPAKVQAISPRIIRLSFAFMLLD